MRGHIGFKILKQQPPAAPSSVTAVADQQALTITLTWTAPPVENKPPITDYVVQYSSDGGANWTTYSHAPYLTPQEITFTTLPANTSFIFRVAARNSAGPGPFTLSDAVMLVRAVAPTNITGSCSTIGASGGEIERLRSLEVAVYSPGSNVIGGHTIASINLNVIDYMFGGDFTFSMVANPNGTTFDIISGNAPYYAPFDDTNTFGPFFKMRARYVGTDPAQAAWTGPWSNWFYSFNTDSLLASFTNGCDYVNPDAIHPGGNIFDTVHLIADVADDASTTGRVALSFEDIAGNHVTDLAFIPNFQNAQFEDQEYRIKVLQFSTNNGTTWQDAPELLQCITRLNVDPGIYSVGNPTCTLTPGETYVFRMVMTSWCDARCYVTNPVYVANSSHITITTQPELAIDTANILVDKRRVDLSVVASTTPAQTLKYQWQVLYDNNSAYYYNEAQPQWIDIVDDWNGVGEPSGPVGLSHYHGATTANLKIKLASQTVASVIYKFRVLIQVADSGAGTYSHVSTITSRQNVFVFSERPPRTPPGAISATRLETAVSPVANLPQLIYPAPISYAQPATTDTGVVLSFFSPCDYVTPKKNFKRVVASLSAANIPFAVTQVVRSGQAPMELPANVPNRVFASEDVLFYKENLWNLGAALLPHKKLVFMDADIEYDALNWVDQTSRALDGVDILQPFGFVLWLDKRGEVCFERSSTASGLAAGGPKAADAITLHPGFAWAMTRKTFDALGGFYTRQPLGNCDTALAIALTPGKLETLARRLNPVVQNTLINVPSFVEYRNRAQSLKLRVGCLHHINARHLWHGEMHNRKYIERDKTYLAACRAAGEPEYPVYFREDGLLQWSDPAASKRARDYFLIRKEDG